ncbi:hypothetical protein HLH12_10185 [Acinetobacter sp. NIPH 2377]|uniref:hypothetical protein n=1 Tax=Acinetobacter terrestris TaxID=2529843 RepID=UPI00148F660B|nr:hypothetical protein [Acinetobacter terrestris]NNH35908.1 hypothetical protein [Acinetobacter terrestris]
MTQSWNNTRFKKSCLASLIAVLLSPSVNALESLSDDHLSNTTGEGVALVLDDFKMVFQAPKDISAGSSYTRNIENPGQADTGFIRIIPTGENYQQLSGRAYDKVYNQVYANTYLNGISANNNLYDNTYTTKLNKYKTDNYASTYASFNTTAFKADVRTGLVEEKYRSALMQEYYTQRYDDYYDGTIVTGLKDDGTTSKTLTAWQKDKSHQYALSNTYEMIELLWGDRTTTSLNNKWTQAVGTRTNIIDGAIPGIVESRTQETLTAEGEKYALTEAQKAVADMLVSVANSATTTAKSAAMSTSVKSLRTKADVFIYGLALSKSDDSLSTRYSNQGFSWGSASNPWLFRAGTENVKQFKNVAKEVGYIALEAPLASIAPNEEDNNIKLGFWSDIFSRELNSSNVVDPVTGAPVSGLDKDYRLRNQFVANGLSLNGSQVRLFQTLESDNKDYSQTLGMASIVRLNTNDQPENLSIIDTNLNSKGIRLSTAAKTNELDGVAATPAIDRSNAPVFHGTEGLYLYSPNINLVLGNMYQPFVVGSEGNNIILEVTHIPNVPSIYNEIYQNYGGGLGTTALKGSTCNVYTCGTPIKNNASDTTALFQGRNATHSSISIGTTERISGTNMLRAKDGANSTGVVFKSVDGASKNFGSAVIDGVLIQHLKIKTTGL